MMCKNYHTLELRRLEYNSITGTPMPTKTKSGVCIATVDLKECKCEGDETMCDFFLKENPKGCETCKHFGDSLEGCRLKNCHRAYTNKELEDKTFVTDAWEKQ